MSTHDLMFHIPPPVAAPRGALWAADAVVWLAKALSWHAPSPDASKGTR